MPFLKDTTDTTGIQLKDVGSDPAAPGAGLKKIYAKAGGIYIEDESSVVTGPLTDGISQTNADARYCQIANNLSEVTAATARTNLDVPVTAHTHAGTTNGVKLAQANTHESPDTDSATSSLHHTIGATATTAAAGNHTGPVFVASGASHAAGHVPDTPASGGTTKYLREDATWDVPAGTGFANPMDSAGDMIIGGVAGAAAKLDAGTSGYHLVAKGATDPAWEAQYSTINFIIDGGGSAITSGVKGDVVIDFACNIISWTLLADTAGAIKIDIWRDSYANFPPTDADTITNAHEPEIAASGVKEQDTDLSDWITNPPAITAGQTLRFNVDSAATITRCTLALKVQRT